MTGHFERDARALAAGLPIDRRLVVLARFGFIQMTAGRIADAAATAEDIEDGLAEAEDLGFFLPEVVSELESLQSWIASAAREKPDPRQEGIDLANRISENPAGLSRLVEIIRTGSTPSLGSKAVADAFDELCRRGQQANALALLDGLEGTEAGHRARLRAGLLLKQTPAARIDPRALIDAAIDDAARMDRAEGTTSKRQFLAGIALMSFDDVDVADRIVRQLGEEGHATLSAGIRQRLALGLLTIGRSAHAVTQLAAIHSEAARERATAAVLEALIAAMGLAGARTLVGAFRTPSALTSVHAKLALAAAGHDQRQARMDLDSAVRAATTLNAADPFYYAALSDLLSAYAAIADPESPAHSMVTSVLGAEGSFEPYRLRLAEHLAGNMATHGRGEALRAVAEELDDEVASVMLMRASVA
ncbi:MAG: hypothetical protein AB7O49_06755 [Sphingomonadales bacterium]